MTRSGARGQRVAAAGSSLRYRDGVYREAPPVTFCAECERAADFTCERCDTPLCLAHAPRAAWSRCRACETDFRAGLTVADRQLFAADPPTGSITRIFRGATTPLGLGVLYLGGFLLALAHHEFALSMGLFGGVLTAVSVAQVVRRARLARRRTRFLGEHKPRMLGPRGEPPRASPP